MNAALLVVSSLSLAVSSGTLAIMVKTAQELKKAKIEVEDFKQKTNRNVLVIKTALEQLEL